MHANRLRQPPLKLEVYFKTAKLVSASLANKEIKGIKVHPKIEAQTVKKSPNKQQSSKNTIRAKFQSENTNRQISYAPSISKYPHISPSLPERRNLSKPQTKKKYGNSCRIYYEPRKDMYSNKIIIIYFEGVIGGFSPLFFNKAEKSSIFLRAGECIIR